jgi:hypothetical protein
MRLLYGSCLLVLTACASAGNSSFTEGPATNCEVPAPSTEVWKQVDAGTFTFCVPATWRQTSGDTYRGEGGWIRWGTGSRPRGRLVRSVVTVPAGQTPSVPGEQRRFTESIGGSVAELWDNQLDGTFYTGAEWKTPAPVYVYGQSKSFSVRNKQLQVYRTVRFSPR